LCTLPTVNQLPGKATIDVRLFLFPADPFSVSTKLATKQKQGLYYHGILIKYFAQPGMVHGFHTGPFG